MYLYVHSVRDFSGFLLYDSFSAFFLTRILGISHIGKVYKKGELPLAEMLPNEAQCASVREFNDKKFAHYLAYMKLLVKVQNRLKCWPKYDRLWAAQNVAEMVDILYQG